ncbi:subunit of tubulin prefoldin [Puccinia graminis f. sp. tritici]|uniref:Subunit of tubulin prefoldin n=1 Tax=Puccinia graminis f. sp. tritici TaxID=56615 RepID=A0A5B0MZ51_PUCGR|nr:subunit of tubulin prefoldin [Puccinia graminis f. sp. tritici]KAA1081099.1 subunit of tubulin prefoldin [Puccinia graminis f. sp. tritici]
MAQSAQGPLNVQDLDASQLASVKEQLDQPIGSARSCLNRKVLGLGLSLDQLQNTIETKQEHAGLVRELIQIKTSARPPQSDPKTS